MHIVSYFKKYGIVREASTKDFQSSRYFLGDTEAAKYANAWAAKRIFAETVILPMLTVTFDNLNTFLIQEKMDLTDVKLKFENPLPYDPDQLIKKQEADTKETQVAMSYMTINELREAKKLKPLPGGDVLPQEYILSKASVSQPSPNKALSPTLPYSAGDTLLMCKDLSPTDKCVQVRNEYLERLEGRYRKKLTSHYKLLVNAIAKGKDEAKRLVTELEVSVMMNNVFPREVGKGGGKRYNRPR